MISLEKFIEELLAEVFWVNRLTTIDYDVITNNYLLKFRNDNGNVIYTEEVSGYSTLYDLYRIGETVNKILNGGGKND